MFNGSTPLWYSGSLGSSPSVASLRYRVREDTASPQLVVKRTGPLSQQNGDGRRLMHRFAVTVLVRVRGNLQQDTSRGWKY